MLYTFIYCLIAAIFTVMLSAAVLNAEPLRREATADVPPDRSPTMVRKVGRTTVYTSADGTRMFCRPVGPNHVCYLEDDGRGDNE